MHFALLSRGLGRTMAAVPKARVVASRTALVTRRVFNNSNVKHATVAAEENLIGHGGPGDKYSSAMQFLHWSLGGGTLAAIGTVLYAQELKGKENAEQKGQVMRLHKSIGLLLMGGIIARVGVRLVSKVPPHLPGPKLQQLAGQATHLGFYAVLLFMPISGITMGYFGGKGLPFFAWTVPGAETPDKPLAGSAYVWHKRAGQVLEYMVPLHVGAVGFHYFKGHNVLKRMLPWN